jgi:hypothetical protein
MAMRKPFLSGRATRALASAALAAIAGCSSTGSNDSTNYLVPNKTLNISRSLTVPVEGAIAGALVLIAIDPLAPNWKVEQSELDPRHFEIVLTMKRFTTGGDGEAWQVFQRRAATIAREHGAAGYRVLDFSEGIDSHVLIARRVARGVVEIAR